MRARATLEARVSASFASSKASLPKPAASLRTCASSLDLRHFCRFHLDGSLTRYAEARFSIDFKRVMTFACGRMQSARVEPNLITYNALIHACAQARAPPRLVRLMHTTFNV